MTNTEQALIADNVARLRRKAGLTQDSLAHESDVGRATVQDIEHVPWRWEKSLTTLRKLAKALDVSIDDLRQPQQIGPHGFTREQVEAIYQRFREVDKLDHRAALKRTRSILQLNATDVPKDLGRNSEKQPRDSSSR